MKYKIGDIVKIKATGEKVRIVLVENFENIENFYWFSNRMFSKKESELKPYCPSRTGKYRNEKGQFVSKNKNYCCSNCGYKFITELALSLHTCYQQPSDSKQRNYQKILTKLDELEKKIDELGRRV